MLLLCDDGWLLLFLFVAVYNCCLLLLFVVVRCCWCSDWCCLLVFVVCSGLFEVCWLQRVVVCCVICVIGRKVLLVGYQWCLLLRRVVVSCVLLCVVCGSFVGVAVCWFPWLSVVVS